MTERKDDVLMLASLEETPAIYLPEISVPDDITDRFIAEEVEGLDDPDALEMLRLTLRRFKKLHEAEIKKKLRLISHKGAKAYVYWQRRKLGEHSNGILTYVAGKHDPDNTNIDKDGQLPNFTLKAIGVGFDVLTANDTEIAEINAAIRTGRLIMTKGRETLLDVPLSMLADYNPQVAVATDGNTSPVTTVLWVLRNSKLERGMLPVRGIHFSKDDTVKVEVRGLSDIPPTSTVPMTLYLAGIVVK